MTEKSAFSKLDHIGVIVRDADKAVEYYQSLGIGPFVLIADKINIIEKRVKGKPIPLDGMLNKEYNGKMGSLQLQILQPVTGDYYWKEFLETRGEGIQHLGFSVDDIDKAMRIASVELWDGQRPEVLVYDYLELIRGGGAGDAASVQAKIESFKQLVSDWRVIGVILHQSGRGSGNRGRAGGIEAGRYASTSESHFLIETWRRWDDTNMDEVERKHYEDEISAGMWKNKSGDGEKAEVNLTIDKSGRLLEPGIVWEQMRIDDE